MLVLGGFGVALFLIGTRIFWKVVTGPGDDNPVGALGFAVGLVSLVPAYGVILHLRRQPLRGHRVWLALASVACVPLLLLLPILWALA